MNLFVLFIFIFSNLYAQNTEVLYADNKRQVTLNKLEKEWLSKKESVDYVYDPDWKPFEWKNDLDEHTGIISDIIQLIEEKSSIDFVAIPTKSWAVSVEKVKSGKVPMFSVIGVTKDRKKYLTFIDKPLFSTPYVLVSRHGEDYLDGFVDTTHKRIITLANSTIENKLKAERKKIHFSVVSTAEDGFKALEDKKADILVINAATAKYYINILGYDDLKIAYKTKLSLDLRIAIRKDMPKEVISIINKSIGLISEKEINDIFYKWTEVTVKKEIDWSFVGYILVVGFSIVLFLVYNTKRLEKMVRKQTFKLESAVELFNKYVISVKLDLSSNILSVNEAFCERSGYSKDELIGIPFISIIDADESKETIEKIKSSLKLTDIYQNEIKYIKKDGGYFWAKTILAPQSNDDVIYEYNAIMQDTTDKKLVEQLAITDALTNIYNRRYFNTILEDIIKNKKDSRLFCLIIIDIDNFKNYNDTYGHQEGDTALVKVTSTLEKSFINSDSYCFRLGGEEFAIISMVEDEKQAIEITKKLQLNLQKLKIKHEYNKTKFVTVSMGVVCKKIDMIKNKDEVFKEADDLLYKAKHNGRNQAFFNFN